MLCWRRTVAAAPDRGLARTASIGRALTGDDRRRPRLTSALPGAASRAAYVPSHRLTARSILTSQHAAAVRVGPRHCSAARRHLSRCRQCGRRLMPGVRSTTCCTNSPPLAAVSSSFTRQSRRLRGTSGGARAGRRTGGRGPAQVLAEAGLELRKHRRPDLCGRTAKDPMRVPACDEGPVLVPQARAARPKSSSTASRYTLATDVPDVHTFLTQEQLDALPRLAEDPLKAVHRLPGAASNGLVGPRPHSRRRDQRDARAVRRPAALRAVPPAAAAEPDRACWMSASSTAWTYYAGGFTAEYGDRMSANHRRAFAATRRGRLLRTRPQPDPRERARLATFARGNGQWLASFRRSNLDEVAGSPSVGPRQTEIHRWLRADRLRWSPATRASLQHAARARQVEVNNSADTEQSVAEYSNTYFWGTLEHDWSPQLTTSALLSYTDVSPQSASRASRSLG